MCPALNVHIFKNAPGKKVKDLIRTPELIGDGRGNRARVV